MKRLLVAGVLASASLALTACNQLQLNEQNDIVCYSGGREILRDRTNGKPQIANEGTIFVSASTGRTTHVLNAECVVQAIGAVQRGSTGENDG